MTKNLFSIVIIIFSVVVYSTVSPNQIQAQSFYKLAADDNTSGSGTGGGSSDDAIYIVAGIAVAAIVGYAIFKRTTSSDEDTTQAYSSSVHKLLKNENERFENRIKQAAESVPVNLLFGIKNPSALLPERTYMVGLSLQL